jgi:hypothetical protein
MHQCNFCSLRSLQEQYGDNLISYKGRYYKKNSPPCEGQGEPLKLPDGTPICFLAWFMEVGIDCTCDSFDPNYDLGDY